MFALTLARALYAVATIQYWIAAAQFKAVDYIVGKIIPQSS